MSVSVRPYGPKAALVDVDSAVEAAALADWARVHGVVADEIVPAAATVLFDGVDATALEAVLTGWRAGSAPAAGAFVEIPVAFDGPDLADVAARWGVSADEVVARLASYELTSAFCGFAPGFAYLAGLPQELAVPRLETPRARVEPGSVALAGSWCGIYPSASPGGWRVVGRTDVVLWDVDAEPPALLAPGTRVRLRPC
ncbi:5-oxoprolinase subunit B family protein [Nocardioides nematodiphilus]|uniref:5-oxoprolinase subunit B family protein n=1 Tax=Nocardioides nematodiphilus TaxID=2849669 RepID=UPI001CD9C33F|nr:allophanate hydrolase subunit 1 [Nocardioides nematodiphilus]MCA1982560.1 allophanate hydrolase subunit 1 [Nocardioides nematodiphilus]